MSIRHLIIYLLILSSVGCSGTFSISRDQEYQATSSILNQSLDKAFQYEIFEKRREETREQLISQGNTHIANLVDPTFPSAIGDVAIIDDPVLHQRLADELSTLLEHWPHEPPKIELVLTDSEGYAASMTEGGTLVINSGTLRDTKTIDEINFILAHEAAHALLDHFKAAENRNTFNTALVATAELAVELDEKTGGFSDTVGTARKATWGAVLANQLIFGPSFDREQEIEADLLAMDLLIKRGQSYKAAFKVIERIFDLYKRKQELLKELCGDDSTGFRKVFSSMFSFQSDEQSEIEKDPSCKADDNLLHALFNQNRHPQPEARLAAAESYADKIYDETDLIPLPEESEDNIATLLSPDGAVARSHLAQKAINLLEAGSIEEAEQLALQSLGENDCTTPKPRLAMYKVYKKKFLTNGDKNLYDKALSHLEIAINGGRATPIIYRLLSDENAGMGNYDEAISLLKDAGNRFENSESYYPLLIKYHHSLGNHEDALDIYQSCKQAKDKLIAAQCIAAEENYQLQQQASDEIEIAEATNTDTEV